MRDVSHKSDTLRTARAEATLRASRATIERVRAGELPKGDPLPVARTAAMLAAKATPNLIPYCHSVPLDQILIDFEVFDEAIVCKSFVKGIYKTGVEIEAIVAASVAALNLYDMLKLIDEGMSIESVRVTEKTGGKSNLRFPAGGRAGVIVVSDSVSAGRSQDLSGPRAAEVLTSFELAVSTTRVVPDEIEDIRAAVRSMTPELDLLVTSGGTGLSPRDRTPEALEPLIEKRLPGVEETIRAYGQRRAPTAMLSRSLAGTVGSCVVLCLPGSPSGVEDGLRAVLPSLMHASGVLRGEGHS